MKPSELKNLITSRIKAGVKRPVFVQSSPGLGKTQIAAQIARELEIDFKAIHAPLLQPEDYGFPVISADKSSVDFVVSREKFPLEGSTCGESGILLIDELSQCDASAQKILANLIQEREIHGKKIKAGWTIVATGNRLSDRAGANRVLSHLMNRQTLVTLDVSLDDWTLWALQNNVKSEVISFLRFRPELLSQFDPQCEVNATPRAWVEGVSAALGNIDSSLEFSVFSGDVGEGPASEFLAFLRVFRDLPSPDAILLNPDKVEVPNEPATLYALTGALSYRASKDNFGRLMTYVKRLPPEFSVLFVKDALRKTPEIAKSNDFTAWAATDGAKLLV